MWKANDNDKNMLYKLQLDGIFPLVLQKGAVIIPFIGTFTYLTLAKYKLFGIQ